MKAFSLPFVHTKDLRNTHFNYGIVKMVNKRLFKVSQTQHLIQTVNKVHDDQHYEIVNFIAFKTLTKLVHILLTFFLIFDLIVPTDFDR